MTASANSPRARLEGSGRPSFCWRAAVRTSRCRHRLIVNSVVQMAKGLGKRTIAEFVGDEETAELLRAGGVDYAHGCYIAPPRPPGSA